jgi:flavin reductase (DIM6/NTAB) family NADH-FMN oxidoreductase RutF
LINPKAERRAFQHRIETYGDPQELVAAPWIKQAPAAFECRRHITLELGKSRQIILGEIVFAHYHPDVIDIDRMRIDPAKLATVARLGGNTCATIRDRFVTPTPTLAEFEAGLAMPEK